MVDANAPNKSARPTAPQIRSLCIKFSLGVMIDAWERMRHGITPGISAQFS